MTHLLFIYGTLKRGCRNAHMMRGATYIGEARTCDAAWDLRAFEGPDYAFPLMLEGDKYIKGELYRVGDALLAALDAFELATPNAAEQQEYERRKIALDNGEKAFVYIALPEMISASTEQSAMIKRAHNIIYWDET